MSPEDSWKAAKSGADSPPKHDGPTLNAELVDIRADKVADSFYSRYERNEAVLFRARLLTIFALTLAAILTLAESWTPSDKLGALIVGLFSAGYVAAEMALWKRKTEIERNSKLWADYAQGQT